MGYPSSGKEARYRNPVEDVKRFLTQFHDGHYRIYNLCSEKDYDVRTRARARGSGSGGGAGAVLAPPPPRASHLLRTARDDAPAARRSPRCSATTWSASPSRTTSRRRCG